MNFSIFEKKSRKMVRKIRRCFQIRSVGFCNVDMTGKIITIIFAPLFNLLRCPPPGLMGVGHFALAGLFRVVGFRCSSEHKMVTSAKGLDPSSIVIGKRRIADFIE